MPAVLEDETKISEEIRRSLEEAMKTIYAFLALCPWSKYFGKTSDSVKNSQRRTLGEIYDNEQATMD